MIYVYVGIKHNNLVGLTYSRYLYEQQVNGSIVAKV